VATDDSPDDRPLQTTSFAVHATRGLIRDPKTRRIAMVVVLTVALVLMVLGSTVLRAALDPHQRPGWFIFFWLVCAWLTITAMLLALFDLLMLRANARRARRELHEEMEKETPSTALDR
jgi:heme/copper-type cytochrome/quinol oxidase subunit 2